MIGRIPDFTKVKAIVVGDAMLDRYVHGRVTRISPEAPVPIFSPEDTTYSAGGAANVARNLKALDCRVELVGAIGRDEEGMRLMRLLDDAGVRHRFGVARSDKTTCKTRFVVGDKHMMRIDRDSSVHWEEKSVRKFTDWATRILKRTDVLLLSDYGKGMLPDAICRALISTARQAGVPVVIDPKGRDYSKYRGASLIKPNLKEFCEVTGCSADGRSRRGQERLVSEARRLGQKLDTDFMLVTLGEDGMILVSSKKEQSYIYLAAKTKEVFDVSGAGDTSMAVIAAALAVKMPIAEAAELANAASGLAVAKSGTSVISAADLEIAHLSQMRSKVVSLDECVRVTTALKASGKVVGFTNGCFDCCHLGHVRSIQSARKLCDTLVVGVNSDAWIRRHKGKGRPLQDEATRVGVLSALECVDYIVVFSSPTALPLVQRIRPAVIAKEGYAIKDWPEGQFVKSTGGKAIELERIAGYSTSAMVSRIKGAE